MKLSILIPTITSRINNFFPLIINRVNSQINKLNRLDIELIGLLDNKKRKVGEKRNDLLHLARGQYVVFIDDDDRISDDYMESIMAVLDDGNCDCVVFDSICNINGRFSCYCKYGIEYEYTQQGADWFGKPAHTMVYSSSIAKKHMFPCEQYGEDISWVLKACPEIKIQKRINKVLYFYDCSTITSETRN